MAKHTAHLSVSQQRAADLLGVSRWTVSRGMDDGTIPCFRVHADGGRRVPVAWLLDKLGIDKLPPEGDEHPHDDESE